MDRVVSLWRLVDIKHQKKKKKKGDSSSEDESSLSLSSSSDSSTTTSSRYAHLLMGSFTFPHCSSTPILSLFSDENEEENEDEQEEGGSSDDVSEVKVKEEEEIKDVKGKGKGKRAKEGKVAPKDTEIKAEGSAQLHDKGKEESKKEATKKKRQRKDKAEEKEEEEEKPTKKRKGKEEEGEEEKPKKKGKAVSVVKLTRFATVEPSRQEAPGLCRYGAPAERGRPPARATPTASRNLPTRWGTSLASNQPRSSSTIVFA